MSNPYQTRILATPTTFASENDGTWLMADYDGDGIPDLIFIKTSNTPNGTVEVHVASGASQYQTRILATPTTFVSEHDGTWLMADYDRDGIPDLVFIKTSNTPSGKVEVHIASGASQYQTRILATPTTFDNEDDGTWLMATFGDVKGIPNLVFIKTSNTPNGTVEVHVASGASGYQARTLATATTFANEIDGTWLMLPNAIPDLVFIKTSNTPNGTVEVHVASGASQYQTRILATPTTFVSEHDGTWLMADYDRDGVADLVFIKTSNTPGGTVEVHVASGLSNDALAAAAASRLKDEAVAAAIAKYGPLIRLHPDESYKMCSIEYFLQHATLHNAVTNTDTVHPGVSDLPTTGSEDDKHYWLVPELGARAGNMSTAKAYVKVLDQGKGYTDIQFWMFYAYNGPGTLHVNGLVFDTIAHSGDVNLSPMGEHAGDWECAMLQIANSTGNLISAWLSQHDKGAWFDPTIIQTLERVPGKSNVVVYSSKNGHAVYPTADSNYTVHIKATSPITFGSGIETFLRNDTGAGDQLDASSQYVIIDSNLWPAGDPRRPAWLNYPYRWGPESTPNVLDSATLNNILTSAFGWAAPLIAGGFLGAVASAVTAAFTVDDASGPDGPKTHGAWTGAYPSYFTGVLAANS